MFGGAFEYTARLVVVLVFGSVRLQGGGVPQQVACKSAGVSPGVDDDSVRTHTDAPAVHV